MDDNTFIDHLRKLDAEALELLSERFGDLCLATQDLQKQMDESVTDIESILGDLAELGVVVSVASKNNDDPA